MHLATTVVLVLAIAAVAQSLAFIWQRRHRNAGIVDAVWSGCVAAAAVLLALLGSGAPLPRMLLALLGGAWGLRLALHLWRRTRGEAEDGRYARLRGRWGNSDAKWFAFFQLQALLVVLFALPFAAVAANPIAGWTHWSVAAIAIWLCAVGGESIADAQLARFRANPANRGRTCNTGLWRYSRHPNYFFEWLHWFAYPLLAVGSPLWWPAWTGPVVMYVFVRYLSGVPFTEANALRTRGEDYRRYQRNTPVFFPWFPKSPSKAAH